MRISDLLAAGDDGVPGEPDERVVAAEVAPQPVGSELLAADTVPDLIEDAEIVEEPVEPPPVVPTDPTDDLLPRRG